MAAHLIPVFTGELTEESTQLCNARDLHAGLNVATRFDDWMRRRISEYRFIEGSDFFVFDSSNLRNQKRRGGDRRSIDYHLTLDMAKELAMIENNDVGRQVRRYFIQCENALRAELRDKASHVLPVKGVKLIRDSLSLKDAIKLQEQSRKVLRMIMEAETKAERLNLHYHLHQIHLTLGMPTIDLADIEDELATSGTEG